MTGHGDQYNQTRRDSAEPTRSISFLEGRPQRSHPIGNEDIVDLLIALNTSASLEQFLRAV
jgi:hypothetical protein